MPDTLYFGSYEQIAEFFRGGRPYFNEMYVKKQVNSSLFFNRLPTDTWPLNSTTQQTGFRFGRAWYDENQPWKEINTNCAGDSCDNDFEVVKMSGTDSYSWSLLRREMVTDWFCVENLLYKLFPAEQVMQIEETNIKISQHVHEEFARANFIGAAGNHWLAVANANGEYCGEFDNDAWYIDQFTGANEASYDLSYIRVKVDPASLSNIALLGLDVLDDILINLQNEDDAYRLDLYEATGMQLLDVIVPDARTERRLFFQNRNADGYYGNSVAGFTEDLKDLKLGIQRIIGNYAFSYDIDAPRYNVDWGFNATLAAYSANDRSTWPRLIRVPRWVRVPAEQGCKYIPNRAYLNADFAISYPFVDKAMVKWMLPAATGYGDVTMPAQDFAGAWEYFNPKTESNPFQKMGRFQAQHRAGMQIKDPTLMHPILHRLEKRRSAQGTSCALNQYYAPSTPPDCYVCNGTGEPA